MAKVKTSRQQTDRIEGEADWDQHRTDQADEDVGGGQAEKHRQRPGEPGQCETLDSEDRRHPDAGGADRADDADLPASL